MSEPTYTIQDLLSPEQAAKDYPLIRELAAQFLGHDDYKGLSLEVVTERLRLEEDRSEQLRQEVADRVSQLAEIRKALGLDCGCTPICTCKYTDIELADSAVDAAQRLASFASSLDIARSSWHEETKLLRQEIAELLRQLQQATRERDTLRTQLTAANCRIERLQVLHDEHGKTQEG